MPYAVVKSSEVLTTGQKVWFMGWWGPTPVPPDMPKAKLQLFPEIPSVNIGTMAAINPTQPDSFVIDFRGSYSNCVAAGPIIYWSPSRRNFKILGVIKRNERDAMQSGPLKSGVLRGYSIDVVVDTINDNPHS